MSLCLTMIVKNEAGVIQRCLRSIKPFIDSYSISDTGSTDNTMDLIRKELAGIPGILESDPWENFGANRNLAFARCKADFAIWIDADEAFECSAASLDLPLEFDGFNILVDNGTYQFEQTRIIRCGPDWHWKGETHEAITFNGVANKGKIESIQIRDFADSSRRMSGNKLPDDLAILERAERTHRNVFYHAQTLAALGRNEEAIEKYKERVSMGGWEEEVYYSLWGAAKLMALQNYPFDKIAGSLYRAYTRRPTRYEALARLCQLLRENKRYDQCYNLSLTKLNPTSDVLFVDNNAFWRIYFEHAHAAEHLGKLDEAKEYFQRVAEIASLWTLPSDFLNLSLAYYQIKRWQDCIEASQKALKLKPDYPEAWSNMCSAYNQLGNFAEGKQAGEEAVRLAPSNQTFKNNLKWAIDGLNKK